MAPVPEIGAMNAPSAATAPMRTQRPARLRRRIRNREEAGRSGARRRVGASTGAVVERSQAVQTLHALVAQVEAENVESVGHSDRVARLAHQLALLAGWSADRASRLYEAALLHDVGKIALRREVLGKPGRLTAEEYEHVKSHAAIGARMVSGLLDAEQVAWVRGHHERWDGGGYPDGLRGADISDGAALLAAADSFDAITSPRAYKAAMSTREALAEVRAGSGRQFAPAAVEHLHEALADTRVAA